MDNNYTTKKNTYIPAGRVLVFSAAAGIVYTIVNGLPDGLVGAHILQHISNGIFFTVLVYIGGFCRQIQRTVNSLEAETHSVSRHLEEFLDLYRSVNNDKSWSKKLQERLENLTSIVGITGTKCLDDYQREFQAINKGFSIQGQEWAMRSYARFWEYLVEEQIRRKSQGHPPLEARMTHSNDLGVWSSSWASSIREQNRRFKESGGRLLRVFIGTETTPNESYQKQMAEMRQLGVETSYLEQDGTIEVKFDFLWIPDLGLVVKWHSSPPEGHLHKCEVLEEVGSHIRNQWLQIQARLEAQTEPTRPED